MTDHTSTTEEPTPAQKHYDAAEYALDLSKDESGDHRRDLIAQAQVHATLAQAASNEALLQFVATHVANTVVDGLKKYLGGTTYNVSVRDEDQFRRQADRAQNLQTKRTF